ncbi:hypothetical protein ARMGADRAFT_443693 [Armillaria gallica]|uniref:Uncharacterized protein n=1 Tax=Armillaria gallica TaxID=47427 RepID=A0A2H3DK01_ARMGA|nr:hypothetical protein ARMGADRAFT_443693 [Armillaria gallica]
MHDFRSRLPPRSPVQLRACANNLPLPDSDIYVFVNILALPELYFRADSPGCTEQSVSAGIVGFGERDIPCFPAYKSAARRLAPRPSSTITSTSSPVDLSLSSSTTVSSTLRHRTRHWVADNVPFPTHPWPVCGGDG